MNDRSGSRRIFVTLMVIALGLVLFLLSPFAEAFIFATVLASTLYPLHARLARKLGGHPEWSAVLLSVAVVLALLLPLGGLGAFIVNEAISGVRFVTETLRSEGMTGLIDKLPSSLEGLVRRLISSLPLDPAHLESALRTSASTHGGRVATMLSGALAATGAILVQGAMMLIAFYFLLVDGLRLVAWVEENSPLEEGQARELLVEFRKVSHSVLVSSVLTSGVQALAALIGYLIARVPHPFFFATMTFFVAFVPAVGAGGVCLLAATFLLALGHPWAALFLALWGLLAVGLVDNLIKPLLVKRGISMHGGLVFFSLLGGIAVFGAVGLLLGPLIITFFLALVRIYSRDYGHAQSARPSSAPRAPDTFRGRSRPDGALLRRRGRSRFSRARRRGG